MTPDDVLNIQGVLAGEQQWAVICADNADILPTLPDKSVDHICSDPPYTQSTSNNARTAPNGRGGSTLGDAKAFITFDGIDGLEGGFTSEALRISKRWALVFCALEQLGAYKTAAGDAWIRAGVWVRTNSAPQFTGDRPGQGCEGLAIMHRKGRKRWNRGGHPATWIGETINGVSNPDRGTLSHPTPKPLWLMLALIEAFTDSDDVICDPYTGSGTTGVACLRLGRRFIGIEKDPKYAQTAVDRLTAESQGQSLRAYRAGQLPMFGESK